MHAHCHAKALTRPERVLALMQRIPQADPVLLDTGCCGMAGAFGAMESKYELSRSVAAPLVQQIENQPAETKVIASGTSCRHQIEHLSQAQPKHIAEILDEALD